MIYWIYQIKMSGAGIHVYQLRILPGLLLRREMRQSDEGGGAAAKQPAEPDPRDQNAGSGAGLHALLPDEPRPDPDAGGRGALPAHPRGLCRDRGRGGRRHAEPDARARERVSRRERGRAALSAAAGAAGVPYALSGCASAYQQPFHAAGHRRPA